MAVKGAGGEGPPPDEFETIAPLEVNLAARGASAPGPPERPRNRRGLLKFLAPLGLVAAALLAAVALWLAPGGRSDGGAAPQRPAPGAPAASSGAAAFADAVPPRAAAPGADGSRAAAAGATAAGSAVPPGQLPPYARARLERERGLARNRLGDLAAAQAALAAMAAAQWAGAEFAAAQAAAEAGDGLFAAGDYPGAEAHYARALSTVQKLLARAPQAAQAAARAGWQALAAQDAAEAGAQFELARAIAEGLQRAADSGAVPAGAGGAAAGIAGNAASGLARARVLPQVLDLLQAGEALAAQGDLQQARRRFAEALKLDGENAAARSALAQVQRRIAKRAFGQAMSQGLLALNAGDLPGARTAFERAAKLAPSSREPAEGLRRVAAAETLARIRALQQRAESAAAQEQWPAAEAHYGALLALDSSLVRAREGAARARARGALDSQLRALLADPWKLAEDAVHRDALEIRARAHAIAPRGPRLAAQLSQLDRVLALARAPLPVRVTSDEETAVRLHRVGDLGRFASLDLQLRPGRYTLQGTRRGYRDVLRSFVLEPGAPPPTIHIRCSEKI